MGKAVVCLFVGSVLFCSVCLAASHSDEAFYKKCIDERVSMCELKAKLSGSTAINTRQYGQRASDQARFYQSYREELVQKMLREGIGRSRPKVDHFLIEAYYESLTQEKATLAHGK